MMMMVIQRRYVVGDSTVELVKVLMEGSLNSIKYSSELMKAVWYRRTGSVADCDIGAVGAAQRA